jgi:amylovoran biosynthesis glycosyltransferase AmsE
MTDLLKFWQYKNKPQNIISILIASYNTKIEFIYECLDSISIQRGNFAIELVWINDGSDETYSAKLEEALKTFSINNNFLSIKYHRLSKNKGLSYALNYGITQCSNEIIFRMDADDIMHELRIITQLKFMLNTPDCVLCGTDIIPFSYVNGKKKQVDRISDHPQKLTWEEYKKKRIFWILNHPTLCFKKSSVLEVGNYDKYLKLPFEDLDLELRILKKYGVVYNIKKNLLLYRIHPDQITLKKNSNKTLENNDLKKELIEKLISSN